MPRDAVHPALRHLPLLEFMAPDVRRLVADSFVPLEFPFGALVVREGEPADAFYVVASGRARALKRTDSGDEIPLGVLKPGDTFGELGLLEDTTRAATVRASSELVALRLDRAIFRALLQQDARLRSSLELHSKRLHLRDFFRLYTPFSQLPTDATEIMLRELESVVAEPGEQVITQGDPSGPMFVVQEGKLRAYRSENGKRLPVGYLRRGDFFGEVSLFKGTPRDATVSSVGRAELLRLGPKTFRKLVSRYPEFRAQIEERISQYDYRALARVPLDFAEEILPADLCAGVTIEPVPAAVPAPAADPITEDVLPETFARRDGRSRRFPFVWQLDEMDCGAACVAMVARHFGRPVALGYVREVVHTALDGTSLMGITQGAQSLGLEAHAIKASKSRLAELPLPAVVHWEGNHWVVLHDVDDRRARIADPGRGLRRIRRAELEDKWSGYAAVFAPTPELENAPLGDRGVGWVWPLVRPHLRTFVKAGVLAIVAAGLSMLFPVLTQQVVDRILLGGETGSLNVAFIAMLGVVAAMLLATIAQRFLIARSAVEIDGTTLDFITGKLLALPMRYFNTRRTGDIARRLAGVRQAREFFVQEGVNALTAAAQLGTALALMFVYSWRLALLFLAMAPAYAALMRFSAHRLRPMFDSLEEAFGKYQSAQIDAIRGIETVKALGAEGVLRGRMLNQFRGLAQRLFRADLTIMLYTGAVQLATFVSLALFLWFGAKEALAQPPRLRVGELVAFNALVLLANGPIIQLLSVWDQLQISAVLVNRLNDVFEQEPEQGEDHSHLTPVPTLDGWVRFSNVSFRYPGLGSGPVLDHVSFEARPGTTVAVVGRSGSGKTTLVKCLAGILEPTEGTIHYDGVDLKTLDYVDLRRRIGFVLQENYLFDDTIARNIALGEGTPDMERVVWAARAAEASEFIDRLPLGYETKVGETGVLLSGGQRQRVAIARALYNRPPVLIMDEATSSLDTEAERAVQENLAGLLRGRTSFVIAHRMSTVRGADQILVLERGRIVERGTHQELMDRRGIYYYLCSQQIAE